MDTEGNSTAMDDAISGATGDAIVEGGKAACGVGGGVIEEYTSLLLFG